MDTSFSIDGKSVGEIMSILERLKSLPNYNHDYATGGLLFYSTLTKNVELFNQLWPQGNDAYIHAAKVLASNLGYNNIGWPRDHSTSCRDVDGVIVREHNKIKVPVNKPDSYKILTGRFDNGTTPEYFLACRVCDPIQAFELAVRERKNNIALQLLEYLLPVDFDIALRIAFESANLVAAHYLMTHKSTIRFSIRDIDVKAVRAVWIDLDGVLKLSVPYPFPQDHDKDCFCQSILDEEVTIDGDPKFDPIDYMYGDAPPTIASLAVGKYTEQWIDRLDEDVGFILPSANINFTKSVNGDFSPMALTKSNNPYEDVDVCKRVAWTARPTSRQCFTNNDLHIPIGQSNIDDTIILTVKGKKYKAEPTETGLQFVLMESKPDIVHGECEKVDPFAGCDYIVPDIDEDIGMKLPHGKYQYVGLGMPMELAPEYKFSADGDFIDQVKAAPDFKPIDYLYDKIAPTIESIKVNPQSGSNIDEDTGMELPTKIINIYDSNTISKVLSGRGAGSSSSVYFKEVYEMFNEFMTA